MSTQSSRILFPVFSLLGFLFLASLPAKAAVTNISTGQAYSLAVTADGTAPFSYQWYHDDVAMSGVTSSTYSGSAKASDAGVYYAKVTNAAGSATSDRITLVFVSSPVFTTQPVSQAVTTGGSVTFAAAASGSPSPSYQWRKNSVDISGATGASYALASVSAADAGSYSVVAANDAGSATSSSAVLTVGAASIAPVITTQPASQTIAPGGSVAFTVVASGSPSPSYQWRKNGVNISGASGASYVFANVSAGDTGSYSVVATNNVGSATSSGAILTVSAAAVAPVITTQPASQSVTSGSSVTFMVAASGSPSPTYQWRKNSVNISGATSASYVLTGATAASAGSFSVVVTNSAGSVTSAGATLTIRAATVAPVFVTQPSSQSFKVGLSVTFSAVASGSPAPSFQWKKNGASIGGATSASFTIANIVAGDAGTYTVVATNAAGSVTSSGAVLTVTAAGSGLARTDFNNDGKTDILWQNIDTNECAVWFMNGTKLDSSAVAGTYADQWKMSGTGDFNGDGQTDILCHNTVTGEISLWLLSGTSIGSQVSLGVQNLSWVIGGVGDFNGDGKPDIVLQNRSTREFTVWLMAGAKVATVVSLGKAAVDWEICGSGDFDGNGKSDLLWQNNVTGQLNVWLMSGTAVTWKAWITTRSLDWQVSGTGDFNGDGKSDLLWQNVLTGECSLWLISSNVVKGKIALGNQPIDWVIRN